MITNTERENSRRDGAGSQQYLEATVRTASPARLRLMLIQRAIDVAGYLSNAWRRGSDLGVNEHSIKLLDLLTELLGGVVGGKTPSENEVCRKVADLYVFLSKHLIAAEPISNADAIDEIKAVLEIEAETWRAACARELASRGPAVSAGGVSRSGGLNLQG